MTAGINDSSCIITVHCLNQSATAAQHAKANEQTLRKQDAAADLNTFKLVLVNNIVIFLSITQNNILVHLLAHKAGKKIKYQPLINNQ